MSADVRGIRDLVKRLERVRSELSSGGGPGGGTAKRVVREMGGLDAKQNAQVFSREVDPETGGRWKRLSPDYEAWKRKNSKSRKVLVLTGELRKSLTAPRNPQRVTQLDGSILSLGTTHRLGPIHIEGNAKKNLPPRPMVGKTAAQLEEQRRAFMKIVLDRVGSLLGGPAGLDFKQAAQALRPDPRRF